MRYKRLINWRLSIVVICLLQCGMFVFGLTRSNAEINISVTSDGGLDTASVINMDTYEYFVDFENEEHFKKWASNGAYKLNFKGLTSERSSTGEKSFKIDVEFKTATYIYFEIPVMIPSVGALQFDGDIFIAEANNGASATLGTDISLFPFAKTGVNVLEKQSVVTKEWVKQTSDIVSIAEEKAENLLAKYCANSTLNDVGIWTDKIALFLYGKQGASITVFVDNISLKGVIPDEDEYKTASQKSWRAYLDRVDSELNELVSKLQTGSEDAEVSAIINEVQNRGYPTPDEISELETMVKQLPEGEIDYAVVDALSSDKNLIDSSDFSKNQTIRIIAAMNEIEPASFAIRNNSSSEFTVQYDGVSVSTNSSLANSIDVRYVKRWYQADGAWNKHWKNNDKTAILVPELLLKNPALIKVDHENEKNYLQVGSGQKSYVDISKRVEVEEQQILSIDEFYVEDSSELQEIKLSPGEYQQYWVALDSKNSISGIYQGNISLKINGTSVLIPLEIVVLPFNLVDSNIEHSLYYRGCLDPDGKGSISSELKSASQLEAELKNIKDHGIKNPTVYQVVEPRKKWAGFSAELLEKTMDDYFRIRKNVGFQSGDLYYLGMTTGTGGADTAIASVVNSFKNVKSIAQKNGFSQTYIYGTDEATGDELLAQKKVWQALHNEEGKIVVAGSGDHITSMGELTDLLVYYDEATQSDIDFMHSKGNKIYKYQNPQSGPENPALFRYKRGLYLWQQGFDGAMDYAYQHSMGSIWNDFDHKTYRDHVFAYPTANGVIDTIAWEGYREGIDDLRYIATLESLLASGKGDNVEKASDYLKKLKTAGEVDLDECRSMLISYIRLIAEF